MVEDGLKVQAAEDAKRPGVVTANQLELATRLRAECQAFLKQGAGTVSDVTAVLSMMATNFGMMIAQAMRQAEVAASAPKVAVATPQESVALQKQAAS